MLKRLQVMVVGGWVAYWILVSPPVPSVLIGFLNWVGVGPRGFGDKVLGTGLDNFITLDHRMSVYMNRLDHF